MRIEMQDLGIWKDEEIGEGGQNVRGIGKFLSR